MVHRRCVVLALAISALLLPAIPSSAYEEDTHFIMTYVICRIVGFKFDDAMTVAAADQAMDDSPGTDPVGVTSFYLANQWKWHALDQGGNMGSSGILQQKDHLFQIAQDISLSSDPQERLLWLGVFFHYQQDTWAHRHHYEGQIIKGVPLAYRYTPPHNFKDYTTYNTGIGHGYDIHQPDRPPFDPAAAYMDLQEGVFYARTFLKNVLHQPVSGYFTYYVPQDVGREEDHWSGKGRFLHQLAPAGNPGSVNRFLSELIRTQVDAYTNAYDGYFFGNTSNQADLEKVVSALASVCQANKELLGNVDIFPAPVDPKSLLMGKSRVRFPGGKNHQGLTCDYLEGKMAGWRTALGFDGGSPSKSLQESTGPWTSGPRFPNDPTITSIAMMPNGAILGVGENHELYIKQIGPDWKTNLNLSWRNVGTGGSLIAVAALGAEVLAVGTDHKLYTRANPFNGAWKPVAKSDDVVAVTVLSGGKILGVGANHQLKVKETLDADWKPAPGSENVLDVAVLPDQTILGVSEKEGYLLFKRSLEAPWQRAPNCGIFKPTSQLELTFPRYEVHLVAVTPLPDGRILGVDTKEVNRLVIKGTGSTL